MQRCQKADDRTEPVSEACEDIQEKQKLTVSEIKTGIIRASAHHRDDEHNPNRSANDQPTLVPPLNDVAYSRQQPRKNTYYYRIIHLSIRRTIDQL